MSPPDGNEVAGPEWPPTDWSWEHKRWQHEAYHPSWSDGPIAIIRKRPRAKRPRGRPTREFSEAFSYIELKARAQLHMSNGMPRRPAIECAMLDGGWQPQTFEEIERVQRELRRLGL